MTILGAVTPAEKQDVDKAHLLVNALFPTVKLVADLHALGAVDLPAPRYGSFPGRRPAAIKVDIWLKIPRAATDGGDVYVTIWFFALQRPGRWQTTEYSMHFGPYPREVKPRVGVNYFFRVCDNPDQGHHFHHHRFPSAHFAGHIPAEAARPPIPSTADPAWFVGILKTFLETKQVPIEVIT